MEESRKHPIINFKRVYQKSNIGSILHLRILSYMGLSLLGA